LAERSDAVAQGLFANASVASSASVPVDAQADNNSKATTATLIRAPKIKRTNNMELLVDTLPVFCAGNKKKSAVRAQRILGAITA
jgi:hypothetical protein